MLYKAHASSKARRRRLAALALAVGVVCCAAQARAYFERVVPSARTTALGGAFVAIANDPSAVLSNPAGLALIPRTSGLATYERPFGVSDVDAGNACAAVPSRAGVLGASWHYLGLRGALSENLVSVAFARHLISTTQDASLSVGLSLDFARVAADATGRSDNFVTGGFGVLLRPFPMIGMGYSVRNLREGDLHLLDGGPGTPMLRQQAWAFSYKWHDRVTLIVERRQDAARQWRNHAGLEIVTHPNLHLRGGADGRHLTAGFGVLWRGIRLDVAMAAHDLLGSTYVLSIGYLPKVKDPYAQSP
jgi:hypothetical protein